MTDNDPQNDPAIEQEKILFAGKTAVIAGILIVLALLTYILIAQIQDTPPDNSVPHATLPLNIPAEPSLAPPVASTPVNDVREVEVAFRVSGTLTQMFFAERAKVEQGDLLAALDKEPFEAALSYAKVQLKVAQEQYNQPPHI